MGGLCTGFYNTHKMEELYRLRRQRFMQAAAKGDLSQMTKILSTQNFSARQAELDWKSALRVAYANKNTNMVNYLLRIGANPKGTDAWGFQPLQEAILQGCFAVVDTLNERGIEWSPDAQSSLEITLRNLASRGDLYEIKQLIRCRISVNAADPDGRTALHLAASCGHLEIVKHLINCAADIQLKDRWNSTAVTDAIRNGHTPVRTALELVLITSRCAPLECGSSLRFHSHATAGLELLDSTEHDETAKIQAMVECCTEHPCGYAAIRTKDHICEGNIACSERSTDSKDIELGMRVQDGITKCCSKKLLRNTTREDLCAGLRLLEQSSSEPESASTAQNDFSVDGDRQSTSSDVISVDRSNVEIVLLDNEHFRAHRPQLRPLPAQAATASRPASLMEQRDGLDLFPPNVTHAIMAGQPPVPISRCTECMSVLSCDIVGITTISAQLPAPRVSALLDRVFARFDRLATVHGVHRVGCVNKNTDSEYIAVTNILLDQEKDHAVTIARFALKIMDAALSILVDEEGPDPDALLQIQIGLHCGPVNTRSEDEDSMTGAQIWKYTLSGDTMETASRMQRYSLPCRIQCSQEFTNALSRQNQGINLMIREGGIEVDGKGWINTYWVCPEPGRPRSPRRSLGQSPNISPVRSPDRSPCRSPFLSPPISPIAYLGSSFCFPDVKPIFEDVSCIVRIDHAERSTLAERITEDQSYNGAQQAAQGQSCSNLHGKGAVERLSSSFEPLTSSTEQT